MKFVSLFVLVFCASLPSTTRSEGMCGSAGKNICTFLVTQDVQLGLLGKIESRFGCRNTFQCLSNQQYIAVGIHTGKLTLQKKPDSLQKDYCNRIRRLMIKIMVTYQYGPSYSQQRIITVNLFVFPYNFGDSFLDKYSNTSELNRMVKANADFDRKTGMAGSMHRIMRMVTQENNPEAFEEMMGAVKVEVALEQAINKIVSKHVQTRTGQLLLFRWSLNSLFSSSALKKLAKEAGCERRQVPKCPTNAEYRTIDGTCNNINNPDFGSAPTALTRLLSAKYYDADGLNEPIGLPGQTNLPDIPATFKVVQKFIKQQDKPERLATRYSHALMQFGQFLDHDLSLSPETENSDRCMKTKCDGSNDFDVPCYTILPLKQFMCTHFARSAAECQIVNGRITTRQQKNVNTAFVDASQVYGSDDKLAKKLRDQTSKKGLLETQSLRGMSGEFLPNDNSELMGPSALCRMFGGCFLGGDMRTNEQMVLTTMHTLFLREHNRIARELGKLNTIWSGEKIYQETRKIVGAVLQKITYEDFVPIIIGRNTLPGYQGFDSTVNPGILNSFSTAAFRFAHSLIRPTFDRLNKGFNPVGKPLLLRHVFFNNTFIRDNGIDELLLGLLRNESQTVDRELAAGILNHLFERPASPGLNLAALNIQRGRDHGLPGYNHFRRRCGLKNAKSFSDTSNEIQNPLNRKLLAELYNDDPNLADLWVTGLAEAPVKGGIVGATFACIIREQMRRTRDGDRFFYMKSGVFTPAQLQEIKKATLSKILCDNLQNIVSVQKDAFLAGSQNQRRVSCDQIPGTDLSAWTEGKTGKCAVKTTSGKCCVLPFVFKGKTYTQCTRYINIYNKLWCSTTYNYDKDRKWEYCADQGNCAVKTTSGKCCVFPFIFRGKKYTKCTRYANIYNKLWCATTYNYDRDKWWGYC